MNMYSDLIKSIEQYIAKADDELEEKLTDEGYTSPKETVKNINDIEDEISDAMDTQTEAFTDSLKDAIVYALSLEFFLSDKWPQFMENDKIGEDLLEIFKKGFSDMLPKLVENYLMETDAELVVDQITKRTTAWIESWSEELANLMKINSHSELEKILRDGLNDGNGIDDIVRDITENGIRNTRYKARRVAITETLRAHSYAREESIRQSPVATGREWVHTGGHRNEARQNHADMNGQIVGKDEAFELVGKDGVTYHPMFPRDMNLPASESVNCHCIHRAVIDKEILGLSLEERKRLQAEAIAADDEAWEAELKAKNNVNVDNDE